VDGGPVIALVDGEHHPSATREALEGLGRELAGVVFCGGEEKLPPGPLDRHYGRPVETDVEPAMARLAPGASAVVDLADEPVLHAGRRLRLAALALHLGLAYEAPGMRLEPPPYERVPFEGPKLAVIGTGKRTGKTAVAGHWARLLAGGDRDAVVVCMGRGGPPEPRVARAGIRLEELLAIAERGEHAASDYLEGAALAGVTTVGCRRVGGGPAGEPAESNVAAGAAVAASLAPEAIIFEGSGSAIPPVAVDRTVCVAGAGPEDPFREYRLLRAQLVLVAEGADAPRTGETLRFALRAEPVEPVPEGARVALFTTGPAEPEGVEPVVRSRNLSRRGALVRDLERAAAERCDLYLTELKAAAIDTVAVRARTQGARVAFVRNRPVGLDGDLDAALLRLAAG
jgi:cyclic 2,3-diphosphoglycerate synthetase